MLFFRINIINQLYFYLNDMINLYFNSSINTSYDYKISKNTYTQQLLYNFNNGSIYLLLDKNKVIGYCIVTNVNNFNKITKQHLDILKIQSFIDLDDYKFINDLICLKKYKPLIMQNVLFNEQKIIIKTDDIYTIYNNNINIPYKIISI